MDHEPAVNPIPAVIMAICMVVIAVELVLTAAGAGIIGGATGIGWRLNVMQDYAFSPAVLDRVWSVGDFDPDLLKRFVTYGFVHGDFIGSCFAAALILALGKFVGDVIRPIPTLIIYFGCLIVGAIAFGVFQSGTTPLFGAYPAIYGLIGAYTYLLWAIIGAQGGNQLQAFRLIGFLLGLQLLFAAIFGTSPIWIAELAAFITGFGLAIVCAPGGWAALVAKLRRD